MANYTNFTIYHDEFYGGFVDVINQNVDAFNGASAGAFLLNTDFHEGNYQKEAFFDRISNVVARRDSASDSAVSDLDMTSDEFVGVKLDRRFGPVLQSIDAWRKIDQDPARMSFVLGQHLARESLKSVLDDGLAACEGKLDATAALEAGGVSSALTTDLLIQGMYKFGDAAGNLRAWVMHSASVAEILRSQVSDGIYRANGVRIMQGQPATLGLPVIVTDSPSLVSFSDVSSGDPVYSVLGLAAGGIEATFSQPQDAVMDLVTGKQNISYRFQAEWSHTIALRGCAWNTASGANPTAAALATGSNWVTKVAENKGLPGVIIKHNIA